MNEPIHEKVSVELIYDRTKGTVFPRRIRWQGRLYTMQKLGYYHKRKEGRNLLHIFDVSDGTMAFRLQCNPETLHWILEEVSDGNAD
ncbi:hypothetical protein HGA88_02370 [Candidatus Roizmanbacteria bacterium]|nr:hypothetical protein [Candidatus Roizmanbacteria bacterium]